jgi:hypothetical protein
MKKVVAIIIAVAMILTSFEVAFAEKNIYISLDGEWNISYYASNEDFEAHRDAKTGVIEVPGAMELQGYGYPGYYFEEEAYWGMPEDDGVKSVGVYTKTFSSETEGSAYLVFNRVSDNLTVYLNSEKVGESKNAEIGSTFEVKLRRGENTLEAVVQRDGSGINKSDNFNLSGLTGSVYLTNKLPYGNAQKYTVKVDNNTLYIGGAPTKLYGVRYTPTYPTCGDTISDEQIEEDLTLIKNYGFNAVWTSAAPASLYEKAEEKGLYVIDEANIYLQNASEDAVLRAVEMVKRHKKYKSIIMWSAGNGNGGRESEAVIKAIEAEDDRPVVQNLNCIAPDFEIYGNTGGFSDWLDTVNEKYIGGFVDEFADKELYWTKNAYKFETYDSAAGKSIEIDGEIKYVGGQAMLGDGKFEEETVKLDSFTVLAYISEPEGDRVIFQSDDGKVKLSVENGRAVMYLNSQRADCSLEEGLVGIAYASGEAQLFAGHSFKAIIDENVSLDGGFSVGEGDGKTAIKYIKIYDSALDLNSLLTGETTSRTVCDIGFENITVKEDNSYEFLAYGGDFGDSPNSYYKSLKGLFTSLREPHTEAAEVRACLVESQVNQGLLGVVVKKRKSEKAKASYVDSKAVIKSVVGELTVNEYGEIESYIYNGKEQLEEPLKPITYRKGTLSEYEREEYPEETYFNTKDFYIEDNIIFVELTNENDGRLIISYSMYEDGDIHVSMQSQFGENSTKPTFLGFVGKVGYTKAYWIGQSFWSQYPDRQSSENYQQSFSADVSDLADNYAVPQENGNRIVKLFDLSSDDGHLYFESDDKLYVTALPYSFDSLDYEDHDENLAFENASYIRVGGYIAGVSGEEKYKLNNSVYGFGFTMTAGDYVSDSDSQSVYIDGKLFTEIAPNVKKYVYRTQGTSNVLSFTNVEMYENYCKTGDYTIYFAPNDTYLSDLAEKSTEGEISKDKYFDSDSITLSGDRFRGESDKVYEKGIAMKAGSEIVYDVSGYDDDVFDVVIGKDSSAMNMNMGWFNRAIFDAEASVEIYLDGKLAAEERGISMFSGKREVSIDISSASELKIVVKGGEKSENTQYEDVVLADAKIVPKGPLVLDFSREGENVSITVLNTDKDSVDVNLTSTNDNAVKSVGAVITKGLYKTVTLRNVEEGATVEAVISGYGKLNLE